MSTIVRQIYPSDLERQGGEYLGAARSWIQQNCIRGDTLTWGSNQEVFPRMTVKMIEELAACVAAAVINDVVKELRKHRIHPKLPENKERQPYMMTVAYDVPGAEEEPGHWFSPNAVSQILTEHQQKLCDYLTVLYQKGYCAATAKNIEMQLQQSKEV